MSLTLNQDISAVSNADLSVVSKDETCFAVFKRALGMTLAQRAELSQDLKIRAVGGRNTAMLALSRVVFGMSASDVQSIEAQLAANEAA